jgi:hypothetical protein
MRTRAGGGTVGDVSAVALRPAATAAEQAVHARPITRLVHGVVAAADPLAQEAEDARLTARRLRAVEQAARDALVQLRGLLTECGADAHDLVGHGLSLVCLHASVGAARLELGEARAPDVVPQVRALTLATERELAALLGGLPRGPLVTRPTTRDGIGEVDRLVDAARRGGQPVTLDREPVAADGPTAELVVAVLREALTNARKHAGAAQVHASLARNGAGVRLVVVNDAGTPMVARGSGQGLAELRRRAEQLGGSLVAGADPCGGWRVSCVLPAWR